jgi:hypothetical protein
MGNFNVLPNNMNCKDRTDVHLDVNELYLLEDTMKSTKPLTEERVGKAVAGCLDDLWEKGLFGVKVIIEDESVLVTSYGVKEKELDLEIESAVQPIAKRFGRDNIITEHQKGVIPAERIQVKIAG